MTGKLIVKNGMYVGIINYKDSNGKYKRKIITTGLKERGNKKEAQQILDDAIENFGENVEKNLNSQSNPTKDITFLDYIDQYIKNKENTLEPEVYSGYNFCFKIMKNFFSSKLKLKEVTYKDILSYYDYLRSVRGNKNVTIKHHAVILSPALRTAFRDDLIPKNPYDFMPKLSREKHKISYYTEEELEQLFKATDSTNIGLVVRVAAFYGFRRSELLGIRWKSIDFENKTITIEHKVVTVSNKVFAKDKLKTFASNRTLPLLSEIETLLLQRKNEIEKNKMLYGNTYNHKYDEYIFVDDIGNLILPDYVTHEFNKILKKNKLKHIRFHDLRHSCASLLVSKGIQMKYIQEWLGHANFNTTADVYSHLNYSSKLESANAISEALTKEQPQQEYDKNIIDNNESIDDEINRLEKELEEKRKQRKKQQDFEM